jgi:hypothetical protein
VVSSVPPGNIGIVPRIDHDLFLPNPFQFTFTKTPSPYAIPYSPESNIKENTTFWKLYLFLSSGEIREYANSVSLVELS